MEVIFSWSRICTVLPIVAILYGAFSIKWIMRLPTGNDKMREIAARYRKAHSYLARQYTTNRTGSAHCSWSRSSRTRLQTALGFGMGAVLSD